MVDISDLGGFNQKESVDSSDNSQRLLEEQKELGLSLNAPVLDDKNQNERQSHIIDLSPNSGEMTEQHLDEALRTYS